MNDELTDIAVIAGVYEPPAPLHEWVAMSLFMATLVLFIIGVGVWA